MKLFVVAYVMAKSKFSSMSNISYDVFVHLNRQKFAMLYF